MKFIVPKSLSIQRSQWDNIDYYIPNYFAKDFCHQVPFRIKFKALTREATILKLERQYGGQNSYDKVKLWTPLTKLNGHLYFLYNKGKIKIHYEHDLINPYQKQICLYGSVNFFRTGEDLNGRIGCDYFGALYRFNNQIKIGPNYNFVLYTRFLSYLQDIRIGGQLVTDLVGQRCLKKDLFMWYAIRKCTFQFKINQDWNQELGFDNKIFNRFTTTIIKKNRNHMLGVQVEVWRKHNTLFKLVTGLLDYNINPKNRLKLKINNKMVGTIMYEFSPAPSIQFSVGSEVHIKDKNKKVKFGGRVNLNV